MGILQTELSRVLERERDETISNNLLAEREGQED